MRRGVIAADGATPRMVHLQLQRGATPERTLLDDPQMYEEIAGLFLRIGDAEFGGLTCHEPGIADLAAGFRIEWRLIQNDRAGFARLEALDFSAVLDERCDHAFGGLGLVAQILGGAEFFPKRKPDALGRRLARTRPGRARLFALAVHGIGEGCKIDADA